MDELEAKIEKYVNIFRENDIRTSQRYDFKESSRGNKHLPQNLWT